MSASKGEHDTAAERPHPLADQLEDLERLRGRTMTAVKAGDKHQAGDLADRLEELTVQVQRAQRQAGAEWRLSMHENNACEEAVAAAQQTKYLARALVAKVT